MNQKLIKVGSSVAAVIPKDLLSRLGKGAGTPIKVEEGKSLGTLTVTLGSSNTITTKRENKILGLTDEFIAQYRKDLERLKDA